MRGQGGLGRWSAHVQTNIRQGILTQFGAGNVEGLAEAALHDVALVVEEGGEGVHQAGDQQGGQAGQAEEQVTGGAHILHSDIIISMFSHDGKMENANGWQ